MADNMTITMDQQDLAKVYRTLEALGDVEREGIVAKGLREGATILVKEGKQYIAHYYPHSKKLIKSPAVLVRKKDGKAYAGFKRPEGAVAHIVSKGTTNRRTRMGYNRGRVTGTHFWEQVVENKGQEAMNTILESVKASMEKIINRNN